MFLETKNTKHKKTFYKRLDCKNLIAVIRVLHTKKYELLKLNILL